MSVLVQRVVDSGCQSSPDTTRMLTFSKILARTCNWRPPNSGLYLIINDNTGSITVIPVSFPTMIHFPEILGLNIFQQCNLYHHVIIT